MSESQSVERRGAKRKLQPGVSDGPEQGVSLEGTGESPDVVVTQVADLVDHLTALTDRVEVGPSGRESMQKAVCCLAEVSQQDDNVETLMEEGAADAVVPLLKLFKGRASNLSDEWVHKIEKHSCLIVDRLATNLDHQRTLVDLGAVRGLVGLLERYGPYAGPANSTTDIVIPATHAIKRLSHPVMRALVRSKGGIPPLVALLDCPNPEVQRAAARALKTLVYDEEGNKNTTVECGALPPLIKMLGSADIRIHGVAVELVSNLVYSCPHINKMVLDEGGLKPIIRLLSSPSPDSQGKAAVLLGQFANSPTPQFSPDIRTTIIQEGALPPLMAAMTNPKKNRMTNHKKNLQFNAVRVLHRLAQSEENAIAIVREGGVQCLRDYLTLCKVKAPEGTKDWVRKTLKLLGEERQVQ